MRITGNISYHVPIRCHQCGAPAVSRHYMLIQQVHVVDLEAVIEADFRTRIPDIPVGWSMSGRDKISCSTCRPPRREQ